MRCGSRLLHSTVILWICKIRHTVQSKHVVSLSCPISIFIRIYCWWCLNTTIWKKWNLHFSPFFHLKKKQWIKINCGDKTLHITLYKWRPSAVTPMSNSCFKQIVFSHFCHFLKSWVGNVTNSRSLCERLAVWAFACQSAQRQTKQKEEWRLGCNLQVDQRRKKKTKTLQINVAIPP